MSSENKVRRVVSNQTEIFSDLEKKVLRYLKTTYQRPYASHTIKAFNQAQDFIRTFEKPVVLDSGCGCGESTLVLAAKYPDHPVIGIDKSQIRLTKAQKK